MSIERNSKNAVKRIEAKIFISKIADYSKLFSLDVFDSKFDILRVDIPE
jgi:hypothetical protein